MYLPIGKLRSNFLETLFSKYCVLDKRVIIGPRIGEDAAVLDFNDRYLIVTTDPITFVTEDIGWYLININANDIAVRGAKPEWFLATLLLPGNKTTEELVENIFSQISRACKELDISLVGGHTEITYGIDRPIVVGQMLGEVEKEKLVITGGSKIGDDIIMTKGIPVEATSIIAREKENELRKRGYSAEWIKKAKNFLYNPGISVIKDAQIAVDSIRVNAMHDPTEGGIAVGLYELASASGVGLEINYDDIIILKEGRDLCHEFNLDFLGVIASGALLISVRPEDSDKLVEKYLKNGIMAKKIGRIMPGEEGIKMIKKGNRIDLPYFYRDEIIKIFGDDGKC